MIDRLADLMEQLHATGATAQQMAIVTNIVAVCLSKPQTKSDAERAMEYRARCRQERHASRDGVTLKEAPHTPQENIYIYNTRAKQKLPLPDDWQPSENHFSYGQSLNLSRADVLGCAEEMRIWAHSSGSEHTKKKCWSLAFMGWMRREAKRRKPKNNVVEFISSGPKRSWAEIKAEKEQSK